MTIFKIFDHLILLENLNPLCICSSRFTPFSINPHSPAFTNSPFRTDRNTSSSMMPSLISPVRLLNSLNCKDCLYLSSESYWSYAGSKFNFVLTVGLSAVFLPSSSINMCCIHELLKILVRIFEDSISSKIFGELGSWKDFTRFKKSGDLRFKTVRRGLYLQKGEGKEESQTEVIYRS